VSARVLRVRFGAIADYVCLGIGLAWSTRFLPTDLTADICEVVHRPVISAKLTSALARCSRFPRFRSANYTRNTFLPIEIMP
jgi:hypothetical protein